MLTRIQAAGDPGRLEQLMRRTTVFAPEVEASVRDILEDVRRRGDQAVRELTERFDRRSPEGESYEIPRERWAAALEQIDPTVRAALERAVERVGAFHERQIEGDYEIRDAGARLALRVSPLQRVGIYVPGGTARYPSSVVMTAVPARVAGVGEIIMVTPGASPETLAAAALSGVDRVFEIGGAQAVAALAFGTATVPRVDKIVGPGNQWVAVAKRMVFGEVDIDSVAGPSEVLVIADDSARAAWVAADLLAQAEHDVEARPVLITTSASLADAVDAELAGQLGRLRRADIARTSIERHGAAVIADDLDAAVDLANRWAPEHLELHVRNAVAVADRITSAGAIFVGPWAPEAAGDYLAGPNHVLPTGGAARYASPLGVYDFRKRTTIIEYERKALLAQAGAITALAEVEGLDAHARSVTVRLGDGDDNA
jgi:histidinol dehydrogenase